jgi:hypothetical protein
MVSPYFFTLVKLSSGYTARLYRMLHATKKKQKGTESNQSAERNPQTFCHRSNPPANRQWRRRPLARQTSHRTYSPRNLRCQEKHSVKHPPGGGRGDEDSG